MGIVCNSIDKPLIGKNNQVALEELKNLGATHYAVTFGIPPVRAVTRRSRLGRLLESLKRRGISTTGYSIGARYLPYGDFALFVGVQLSPDQVGKEVWISENS